MGGPLGSALRLGVAATPGWAPHGQWGAAEPAHLGSRMWRRRAQGVVSPPWTVPSALSLLAQRDCSEFLLTCQTPGSGSFASIQDRTGAGGSQAAWRAWLCLVCCPAPRLLCDGQHHPEYWLSLHPLLLPGPWPAPPRCRMKIRSSLCLCLHPCAQPLQRPGRPPCSATLPALGWATSRCPWVVPLLEIKA